MKPTTKGQEEDNNNNKEEEKEVDEDWGIWDCGSPLYDSYELVSLSHLIERHLMTLPYNSLGGSRRFINQLSRRSADVGPPIKANVGTTKLPKGSSMVASLSEFVERKKEENYNQLKKRKTSRLLGFYNRIVSWRK